VALLAGLAFIFGYGQMRYTEDKEKGTVTVYEGDRKESKVEQEHQKYILKYKKN
jgi:hypothetical protein